MPPRKRRSKAKYVQASPSARPAHWHRDAQDAVDPTCLRNEGYITNCDNSRSQHPIHSLPPEILSGVFILALDLDSTEFHYRSHLQHKKRLQVFNPLVLGAVCSSWRSIAFSIPQLWQRVLVHFPLDLTECVAKERATYLVEWIKRSRSLPLALHMSCDKKLPTGTGIEVPILLVLDDYANRWETLSFQDDYSALRLPLRPSSVALSTFFHFTGWTSRLIQRIYLWHYYYLLPTADPIPWAQLTHLHTRDHISCEDAKYILTKCQKLVELSILLGSLGMVEDPVISNNLVTLSIKTDYPGIGLQRLLAQLALPLLRNLCMDGATSQNTQPLLNFLTRSSCALDKLEIRGLYLTSRDHLDILAHKSCYSLTSLKVLELERPTGVDWRGVLVDDEVLQRLTLHRDDTLSPHLKSLTFDCLIECSFSAILMMMESRVGSCTGELPHEPIHYVHFPRIRSHGGLRKLDEVCKASGLEYTRRRFHVEHLGHYFYSILLRRHESWAS